MAGTKGTGGPRQEVNTGRTKLYVRRNDKGQFSQATEVGKSLSADSRQHAKNRKSRGEGDRGD
ncbi:MAG: hypothetical protein M3082_14305 [Candidatus Dormibacteraeota bacterium]|nr:hypothetical protein [Candidatus Dormibacteraeota bacterium]